MTICGCWSIFLNEGVTSLAYIFGGLSLLSNQLVAWHMRISDQQFGILPIGIYLSNLDSRCLKTSPRAVFDLL